MPMTLYSPSFTSKPRKAVKALYNNPRECGNSMCFVRRISLPFPTPQVAVTQSPTPSTVKIADSSYGEQRNALAAWERWCSENNILLRSIPNSDCNVLATHILSMIQLIMDSRNTFQDCG